LLASLKQATWCSLNRIDAAPKAQAPQKQDQLLQVVGNGLQSSKRELLSRGLELRGVERLGSGIDDEGGAASVLVAEGLPWGREGFDAVGLDPVDLDFAGE
jgi:hypothetical protein